ncbi:rod shape-determining protein RodA [Bacteroidia bacterium]|nr:rod shape-determining protein RodA [Bacteroidia bacterium]
MKHIDYKLILFYLFFVVFGWFNINSASSGMDADAWSISPTAIKQLIFIGISFLLAIVILLIDRNVLINTSYLLYGIGTVFLIGVLIFGTKISGARSWFQFGSISFQPSEFAKVSVSMALASFLSNYHVSLKSLKAIIIVCIIILANAILILLQPDTGSALIFAALLIMLYREGLPGWIIITFFSIIFILVAAIAFNWWIAALAVLVITAVAFLIFKIKRNLPNILVAVFICLASTGIAYSSQYAFGKLQSHQQDRINVLFGKVHDPKGIAYNINQSKIAIGSGKIIPQGYMEGVQTRYKFIPEQHTDFIFSAIAEEWGFMGCIGLLLAFFFFIKRIFMLAELQTLKYARILGYCLGSIIFFQVFINIGMVMGLLPVIGIPLPFFSYGGSSMICLTLFLFIFIKIDSQGRELK